MSIDKYTSSNLSKKNNMPASQVIKLYCDMWGILPTWKPYKDAYMGQCTAQINGVYQKKVVYDNYRIDEMNHSRIPSLVAILY